MIYRIGEDEEQHYFYVQHRRPNWMKKRNREEIDAAKKAKIEEGENPDEEEEDEWVTRMRIIQSDVFDDRMTGTFGGGENPDEGGGGGGGDGGRGGGVERDRFKWPEAFLPNVEKALRTMDWFGEDLICTSTRFVDFRQSKAKSFKDSSSSSSSSSPSRSVLNSLSLSFPHPSSSHPVVQQTLTCDSYFIRSRTTGEILYFLKLESRDQMLEILKNEFGIETKLRKEEERRGEGKEKEGEEEFWNLKFRKRREKGDGNPKKLEKILSPTLEELSRWNEMFNQICGERVRKRDEFERERRLKEGFDRGESNDGNDGGNSGEILQTLGQLLSGLEEEKEEQRPNAKDFQLLASKL